MKQNKPAKIDVEKLASLAKLNISQDELSFLQKEMTDIINFACQVNTATDDNASKCIANKKVSNVLREDENENLFSKAELISNSMRINGEYFCIPQIIEWKYECL